MTDLPVQRFAGPDGSNLAYRMVGHGRPLIALHGFTATGRQWLEHGPAAALADGGRRVILPDLRGHGDSVAAAEPGRCRPDVLARDGLALIAALGLVDGHFDLAGYSLGGRIVLRMLIAGARPGRAVVGGQGLTSVSRTIGPEDAYRRVLSALIDGAPIKPGRDATIAHWITTLGGDPRALRAVRESLVPTTRAELGAVTTPTLVVTGTDDPDAGSAAELAAALPAGRSVSVPGDHFTALGDPEFAAALTAFLGPTGPR